MKYKNLLAAGITATLFVTPASAGSRFVSEPPEPEKLRAVRYAAMESEACIAELTSRNVPFTRIAPTKGVDTPVRLTGPLHGVSFEVAIPYVPPRPPEDDYRTIADCRLLLALDDLSLLLKREGVVTARYYSMYRKTGLGFVKPGKRHPGARAIDLVSVSLSDGTTYSVQNDFHGRGATWTCGPKASKPARETPGALFWRKLVCGMDETRSFNLLLSPNHDWGHRDHLHMEVRSGINWFLIH